MTGSYKDYKNNAIVHYVDSLKNGSRIFPPSLQIGITDFCFNKCPMCGHWRRNPKYEIDILTLKEFLKFGKNLGLESVGYSGGDPFAYANMNTLMEWHIANNVAFGIVTGGCFRKSHVEIDLLRHASWVRVSLDAVDPKTYSEIRGGIDVRYVLGSITDMIEGGVKIGIGITAHAGNIHDIEDILKYSETAGLSQVRIWHIRKHSNMSLSHEQLSHLKFLLSCWGGIFDDLGIDHNFYTNEGAEKFQMCKTALYQLFIDAQGEIYHCCTTAGDTESEGRIESFGNIYSVHFLKDWHAINKEIVKFSNLPFAELPNICREECIVRHTIANKIAYEEWDKIYFQ